MSGAPDGGGGPARSPVPPLWAVVAGRLFLAGLKTPVALLLVWLATLLPAVGHRELSDLIAAVIASALLGE